MGEKSEEVFETLPIHPEAMQPVVRMVSGDLLIMSETVHRALKPLEHMVSFRRAELTRYRMSNLFTEGSH
jgi:hypothetical protein